MGLMQDLYGRNPHPRGLMAPLEIQKRGTVVPAGVDQYGRPVLAAPQGLLDFLNSARGLIDNPVTLDNITSPQMVGDAANVAGGVTLGAGAIPKQGAELGMGIRAYHGSPHDFDKFRLADDTIGTGEGAQAYGHGLYFAENEGVAKSYRDVLGRDASNRSLSVEGEARKLPQWVANRLDSGGDIDGLINTFKGRIAETEAKLKNPDAVQPWLLEGNLKGLGEIVDTLEKVKSGRATVPPAGRMYEVDINADPEDFLDWDKPLSEQPEKVRSAVQAVAEGKEDFDRFDNLAVAAIRGAHPRSQEFSPSGREIYDDIGRPEPFIEAGIPGIRYLDQGSRSGGEGTSNYVLFRDDIIDIVKKYGWAAVAPMLGAGAGLMKPENNTLYGEN